MSEFAFDYVLDEKGPRGIGVESWLDRSRIGLMIIDMQNYMTLPRFSGTWTAAGADRYYYPRSDSVVIPNIARLTGLFRELGRPVIYTRIASLNRNLRDVPGLARKVLAQETRDVKGEGYHLHIDELASQVDERLAPKPDDIVICKTGSGAFCSADTDSILRNNGVSRLVFTGGLTDACVASSVREAYDRGYLCTIVEDACITSTPEDHDAALRSLRKFFGWVSTTQEVISVLRGHAEARAGGPVSAT
jgi:nicotinamidase-related amidase